MHRCATRAGAERSTGVDQPERTKCKRAREHPEVKYEYANCRPAASLWQQGGNTDDA